MPKLVEYITPTWIPEKEGECIPIYDPAIDGERIELVRCKDCIHRGKSEKCVLAAISEEKDYPLFMLDNRGEWFCADGERG